MSESSGGPSRPAVFLDRDGTLIEEMGYLGQPERVTLFPWSVAAVSALNRAGWLVVLVTNQAGVARGYFDEGTVEAVHRQLAQLLDAGGAFLDAYYYCPHHPSGTVAAYTRTCGCRKPATGLVDKAVAELGIDVARSFVVGDRWLDVALGRNAGARSVLVRTGYGAEEELAPPGDLSADVVVDDLGQAVEWILARVPGTAE